VADAGFATGDARVPKRNATDGCVRVSSYVDDRLVARFLLANGSASHRIRLRRKLFWLWPNQEAIAHDSIVAPSRHAADFFNRIGHDR
jgi:hypothetical protein